ncbi:hypothetical protein [Streptomyces sp. NPDC014685]|uniref:hypothetical protein n=1 Tax=Streptomyces sp. NPDC014685 TaxID=3364881 RepID=UPI0036F83D98
MRGLSAAIAGYAVASNAGTALGPSPVRAGRWPLRKPNSTMGASATICRTGLELLRESPYPQALQAVAVDQCHGGDDVRTVESC